MEGMEQNMEDLTKIQAEIQLNKERHSSLLREIDEMEKEKLCFEEFNKNLQDNLEKQKKKLLENEEELKKKGLGHEKELEMMLEKNQRQEELNKNMEGRIGYIERETENLKKICFSGMEKKMVFKGNVSNTMSSLSVKHQIKYPVNGGSALITFQTPSVATQIIAAEHHKVSIEECWIYVKAETVELPILDALRMEMSMSPTKILVHNLPSDMKEEVIMDKLELFFGKSKNGGGEVEKREFLADCRSAILTFLDKEVASRLVAKKSFHVPFGEYSQQVYVAPSLEGNLQNYKMRRLVCNRTVLLTGIPDITDKDNLRDLLEIHFQKPSNGGGEVQELMYCPVGQQAVALFEDDAELIE